MRVLPSLDQIGAAAEKKLESLRGRRERIVAAAARGSSHILFRVGEGRLTCADLCLYRHKYEKSIGAEADFCGWRPNRKRPRRTRSGFAFPDKCDTVRRHPELHPILLATMP